jgi:hypothetical protein
MEPNAVRRALDHPLAPIALIIGSDFCFVLMDGMVQHLEHSGVPPGEIAFLRMVCAFKHL